MCCDPSQTVVVRTQPVSLSPSRGDREQVGVRWVANRGQIGTVFSGPSDCTEVSLFVFRPRRVSPVTYWAGAVGSGAVRGVRYARV